MHHLINAVKRKTFYAPVNRVIAVSCLLISTGVLQGCMDLVTQAQAKETGHSKKGVEFRIAIIPDTQYYTAQVKGGKIEMFREQIKWIKDHQIDSNIVYVSGMGDIVDDWGNGDPLDQQWINAKDNGGYYSLETPAPGIPYGLAIGNHDEADTAYTLKKGPYHNRPGISPVRNTTKNYNEFFGVDHFKGKPYYGGHANILGKNNNDCHFDKFTVGGQKYIVIYLPYDNENYEDKDELMNKWADSVVQANAKAKAIIVTHGMLKGGPVENGQNPWGPQGQRIYDILKHNPNVFLFLCGHVNQGFRQDVYNGHLIRTYMSDYQGEKNGGNGKMRTMRINTVTDSISIRTFSPYMKQ